MYETIPAAIRDLMAKRWQPTRNGHSFFQSRWQGDPRVQNDPSWYTYSKEPEGETTNILTTAEAATLAQVPEFELMAIEWEDHYSVNEHLEHALSDFMSKVYDAWDEFADRAKTIEAHQKPQGD